MTSNTFRSSAYTFTASVDDLVYLWGGQGNVENDAVFIYHHSSEKWEKKLTGGQHPPAGLSNGGCTMSSHNLYLYGGFYRGFNGKNIYNGDLYELNTVTWRWSKLSDGSAGGPGKKHGCRLISYQHQLLVVGGAYENDDMMPASKQSGAEYLKGHMFVCTNEVHYYSLLTRWWNSPPTGGVRPPPCYDFSLTKINEKHAVMFGGNTSVSRSSDLYVLDMSEKTWSQHEEGYPWPGARLGHIAACLNYGGQNPRLLISGGSAGNHTYHDMWLLDMQSHTMKEVQVQVQDKDKKLQKSGHGAAAVTVNSDCEEVILFGRKKRCDALVLKFMLDKGQWTLTGIVDKSHLGSPVQHAIKRKMFQSSSSQEGNNCKLQKQEEDANTGAAELQTQADDANRRDEDSSGRGELPTEVQHSEYRFSLEKSLVETSAHGEEMIELVDLHSKPEETTTSQEETETQN